jgi:hypothetical protein
MKFYSVAACWMLGGNVNDHTLIGESITNHSNRGDKIGIAAHQHKKIAFVLVCVVQHINSDIDVCAFSSCASKNFFPVYVHGANLHSTRFFLKLPSIGSTSGVVASARR